MLIITTAAFHLRKLFVCGFWDCCHYRQGNTVGWGSFLFNDPTSRYSRVTGKFNGEVPSLKLRQALAIRETCPKSQEPVSSKDSLLDLHLQNLCGFFSALREHVIKKICSSQARLQTSFLSGLPRHLLKTYWEGKRSEGILPIKRIPLACCGYILIEEISIFFQISNTIYFDSFSYSKSS